MISKYIKLSLPITITFDNIIKILTSIFFIFYVIGFLVWNMYLSQYGFFEYNLLQTRYISAGVLFLIITFFVFSAFFVLFNLLNYFFRFLKFVYKKINKLLVNFEDQGIKINKKHERIFFYGLLQIIFFSICGIVLLFYFLLFTFIIFPNIPQHFGGSRAIPASLLGSSDQMIYLSNYGIGLEDNSAGKSSVQTKPMCILYQNQEFILVGVLDWKKDGNLISSYPTRILNFKKDQISGLQLRGGWVGRIKCPAVYFYDL